MITKRLTSEVSNYPRRTENCEWPSGQGKLNSQNKYTFGVEHDSRVLKKAGYFGLNLASIDSESGNAGLRV